MKFQSEIQWPTASAAESRTANHRDREAAPAGKRLPHKLLPHFRPDLKGDVERLHTALRRSPRPANIKAPLQVRVAPVADTARYDRLRDIQEAMRDVIAKVKALHLHGLAPTRADLIKQKKAELERRRWLVEQMLRAEKTEQARRTTSHLLNVAKVFAHRDLAGLDFEVSPVKRKRVLQLSKKSQCFDWLLTPTWVLRSDTKRAVENQHGRRKGEKA